MQLLHWKLSAHNGINGWLITYGDPPEQIFWLDTANCGSGGPLLSREQLISGPHFDRLSNYFVIWQIASIYTPLIMVYFWLVRNKQKILLWFAQSQLSCMRVVTYDRYARRDKQFPFSLYKEGDTVIHSVNSDKEVFCMQTYTSSYGEVLGYKANPTTCYIRAACKLMSHYLDETV